MATHTAQAPLDTEAAITFSATLYALGEWIVLRLPADASKQLPTRGQVMVAGTVNGNAFFAPLEPDGNWSHWLNVDSELVKKLQVAAGDTVNASVTPIKTWSEPDVPADLMTAVKADKQTAELWQSITPLARWEWVRWTRSTANPETRKRRVEVAISKMKHGERRPCCWNRNLCTIPEVSKNGVLLDAPS